MIKRKKLLLAGIAMAIGFASTSSVARPSCEDLEMLCAAGIERWCVMLANDATCL